MVATTVMAATMVMVATTVMAATMVMVATTVMAATMVMVATTVMVATMVMVRSAAGTVVRSRRQGRRHRRHRKQTAKQPSPRPSAGAAGPLAPYRGVIFWVPWSSTTLLRRAGNVNTPARAARLRPRSFMRLDCVFTSVARRADRGSAGPRRRHPRASWSGVGSPTRMPFIRTSPLNRGLLFQPCPGTSLAVTNGGDYTDSGLLVNT